MAHGCAWWFVFKRETRKREKEGATDKKNASIAPTAALYTWADESVIEAQHTQTTPRLLLHDW